MTKKNKISAFFKEDIQKLLQSINEIKPIENGERICNVCSKIITLENIQIIIPRQGGTFDFICNSPVCVQEYNLKKSLNNG